MNMHILTHDAAIRSFAKSLSGQGIAMNMLPSDGALQPTKSLSMRRTDNADEDHPLPMNFNCQNILRGQAYGLSRRLIEWPGNDANSIDGKGITGKRLQTGIPFLKDPRVSRASDPVPACVSKAGRVIR
jgi:hypothetical protein